MASLSVSDRCVYSLMGAAFGLLYGVFIAVVAMLISGGEWSNAYILATALVFGVLAFLIGPFIGDAIAGVLHLLWGVLHGLALTGPADPRQPSAHNPPFLASLFWFGICTGVALFLAIYVW